MTERGTNQYERLRDGVTGAKADAINLVATVRGGIYQIEEKNWR